MRRAMVWALDVLGICLLAAAGFAVHWGVSLAVSGVGALLLSRLAEKGEPK